jgi:ABC-type branched-subunit amino acid transport system substrate-binding protein
MVRTTASLSDTWRIGVLFSRTGLTAVTETEHFLGTALAIQEINQAGGVIGARSKSSPTILNRTRRPIAVWPIVF